MKNTKDKLNGKKIKRIAVFRAMQLGNMLCAIPALRALRANFPYSQISLIGLPWAASFTERYSAYIDDFISFPGFPGLPEQKFNFQRFLPFIEEVKNRNYDLVLQIQDDGNITNALVMLFGGKMTGGFCPDKKDRPGELFFHYPRFGQEIYRLLNLMMYLGVPLKGDYLELPVYENEKREYEKIRAFYGLEEKKYICIHPGSGELKKRVSPDVFIKIAKDLYIKGYQIVITGSENEHWLCSQIKKEIGYPLIDLSGRTRDLGVLASFIKKSALTISNDTSISHVAQAVESPSIILFKNSDQERWSPLNKSLHKSIGREKSDNTYFIMKTAERLLEKNILFKGGTAQ